MKVRMLKTDELEHLGQLYRNAYRIDAATASRWLKDIAPENTFVIADEQRVLSAIQIIPYRTVIGGRSLPMGGIGGVATWADAQGHGFATRLMKASIAEMHNRGYAISFLYPFSYRYYGKLGWALSGRRVVYANIRPGDLPRHDSPYRVRAIVAPEDWQLAADGYSHGHEQYNCLVEREALHWARLGHRQEHERFQCYAIVDEEGKAGGYFSCEDVEFAPYHYETVVRELVCADRWAYSAFFNFLRTLPLNVKRVTIGHAEKPWLWPYFQEPVVETRVDPWFQTRVIDVERACQLRGYCPSVAATIVFALHDPLAPWNEGTWELCVDEGRSSIKRVACSPEIELSIEQFSAIFTGFLDPIDLRDELGQSRETTNALKRLRTIFHDRPVHLIDFF